MDGESDFEKHRLDDKSGFGVGAGSNLFTISGKLTGVISKPMWN